MGVLEREFIGLNIQAEIKDVFIGERTLHIHRQHGVGRNQRLRQLDMRLAIGQKADGMASYPDINQFSSN